MCVCVCATERIYHQTLCLKHAVPQRMLCLNACCASSMLCLNACCASSMLCLNACDASHVCLPCVQCLPFVRCLPFVQCLPCVQCLLYVQCLPRMQSAAAGDLTRFYLALRPQQLRACNFCEDKRKASGRSPVVVVVVVVVLVAAVLVGERGTWSKPKSTNCMPLTCVMAFVSSTHPCICMHMHSTTSVHSSPQPLT